MTRFLSCWMQRLGLTRLDCLTAPLTALLCFLILCPTGCHKSSGMREDSAVPSRVATTDTAPSSTATDFDRRVTDLRSKAEHLDQGSALLVSFKQTSSGSLRTLAYVDATPPEQRGSLSLIQAQAFVDNEVVSTFVLLLPRLSPGTYRCQTEGMRLGAALGESRWDPTAHDTGWTHNSGGYCEIELRRSGTGRDLEGTFSGKLETNDGQGYYLVDRGYVYLKVAAGPASQSSDTALEQGVSCHKAGDYLCALRRFKEACQAGAAEGCFNLGIMFDNGHGIDKDLGQALVFYEKSCQLGSAKGGANLVKTLAVVCEEGNASACGVLGEILLEGKVCHRIPFPPQLSLGRQLVCKGCAAGNDESCKIARRMETQCQNAPRVR